MAVNILLVTHPDVGAALKKTALVLLGGQLPARVETLAAPWAADADETLAAARALCDELGAGADGVLVLCDLFGATPANIGARLAAPRKVAVVCGVNRPMLLKALNYCHLALDALVEKAKRGGLDGVVAN